LRKTLALFAIVASNLGAQDNTLDLRVAELDRHGDVVYQNFIYARSLAGGRFVAQANYLRLDGGDYNEGAAALGVRFARLGDITFYALAGVGKATDATYAEPAVLALDTKGKFTGSLYVQRYVAINDAGTDQWLLDTIEGQYALRGPLYLGAAVYAYRADGTDWFTRAGPKIGATDKHGATEVRVTRSTRYSPQLQLRRIVLF